MPGEYDELEKSIQKILKEIGVIEDDRKKYTECMNLVINHVEEGMKKKQVFKEVFNQKLFVGSSYENLKIDAPNEFDIDFELVIPSWMGCLEPTPTKPAYCSLWLNEEKASRKPEKPEITKEVKKWFNDEGYLLRSKVYRWMKSMVDQVFEVYGHVELNGEVFEITRLESGPAVTLCVKLESKGITFSVDIVPVFGFKEWPDNCRSWNGEEKKWYAVPKSKDEDTDFRLSFFHQEKELLHDRNPLKPTLKLIKKLRDVKGWGGISSYYIKTIFLWKNDEITKEEWYKKSKSEAFLEMLEEFKKYLLDEETLPYYWNENFNLFEDLKEEKKNYGRNIENIIKDIKNNLQVPNYLDKIFKKDANTELTPDEDLSQSTSPLGPLDWAAIGVGVVGVAALAGVAILAASQPPRERRRRNSNDRENENGNQCAVM